MAFTPRYGRLTPEEEEMTRAARAGVLGDVRAPVTIPLTDPLPVQTPPPVQVPDVTAGVLSDIRAADPRAAASALRPDAPLYAPDEVVPEADMGPLDDGASLFDPPDAPDVRPPGTITIGQAPRTGATGVRGREQPAATRERIDKFTGQSLGNETQSPYGLSWQPPKRESVEGLNRLREAEAQDEAAARRSRRLAGVGLGLGILGMVTGSDALVGAGSMGTGASTVVDRDRAQRERARQERDYAQRLDVAGQDFDRNRMIASDARETERLGLDQRAASAREAAAAASAASPADVTAARARLDAVLRGAPGPIRDRYAPQYTNLIGSGSTDDLLAMADDIQREVGDYEFARGTAPTMSIDPRTGLTRIIPGRAAPSQAPTIELPPFAGTPGAAATTTAAPAPAAPNTFGGAGTSLRFQDAAAPAPRRGGGAPRPAAPGAPAPSAQPPVDPERAAWGEIFLQAVPDLGDEYDQAWTAARDAGLTMDMARTPTGQSIIRNAVRSYRGSSPHDRAIMDREARNSMVAEMQGRDVYVPQTPEIGRIRAALAEAHTDRVAPFDSARVALLTARRAGAPDHLIRAALQGGTDAGGIARLVIQSGIAERDRPAVDRALQRLMTTTSAVRQAYARGLSGAAISDPEWAEFNRILSLDSPWTMETDHFLNTMTTLANIGRRGERTIAGRSGREDWSDALYRELYPRPRGGGSR